MAVDATGVAAPSGTEPVGAAGELGLVVRLKQQAHHLADELVRPGRQAQRAPASATSSNSGPAYVRTSRRGTVALRHPVHSQGMITRMRR